MAVLFSVSRGGVRATLAATVAALALSGCGTTSSSSTSNGGSDVIQAAGTTLSIYLSQPAHADAGQRDIVDAEQLAFAQHSAGVSHFKLVVHVLSDSLLSDNARYAIQDKASIAYLGELVPGTSEQTIGITNALDLLQISPTDTALETTAASPVISNTPQKYYEGWTYYGRTFAQMVPTTAQEAAFAVAKLQAKHLSSLYIANDGSDYGRTLAAEISSYAAKRGISTSGTQAGAAAIYYAGNSFADAARFFNAAATSNTRAELFGPSALDNTSFLQSLSGATKQRLYVSVPGIATDALDAAGKAFESSFKVRYGHSPAAQAIFGYAAMSALLEAIRQAGLNADNRTTVKNDLFALRNEPSVLGTISMNSDGNTSFDGFILNRVEGDTLTPVATASR